MEGKRDGWINRLYTLDGYLIGLQGHNGKEFAGDHIEPSPPPARARRQARAAPQAAPKARKSTNAAALTIAACNFCPR